MNIIGDIAQTFFVDSAAAKKASHVFISSIDLYFKTKPTAGSSSTSLPKPGVTIYLCDTVNSSTNIPYPDVSKTHRGRARAEYSAIIADSSGATPTKFTFNVPVGLETDKTYGMVIKFDGADTGFSLWRNKANETYNQVKSPAVTKGALDGYFFTLTNGEVTTPQPDVDLKFTVRVNTFTLTPTTFSVVNRNFEIISINNDTMTGNNFVGGEHVFAHNGYPSGQTVNISASSNTVVGTNTRFQSDFAVDDHIVINHGNKHEVRRITAISNNTHIKLDYAPSYTNTSSKYLRTSVGKVFDHKRDQGHVTLVSSTANSVTNFNPNTVSNTIVGTISGGTVNVNRVYAFPLSEFTPKFKYTTPIGTSVNTSIRLANTSVSTDPTTFNLQNHTRTRFNSFGARLYSRSDEAMYGGDLENYKSVNIDLTLSTTNEFSSPIVNEEDLNFLGYRRIINANFDNENKSSGSALAKYVSKRITLAEGQDSEDIRVYATMYRPYGTDVNVFVKFYNDSDPESFDSKDWTLLEATGSSVKYSSAQNYSDLVEIEYKLPAYPLYTVPYQDTLSAGPLLSGTFTGSDANNVLVGTSGTVNTEISIGSLARIYDPLFANNSLTAVVIDANTSSITIDTALSSSNTVLQGFISSGLVVDNVDKINTAFANYTSNGVIRYYNSQMSAFDTYKSFAIKVVLTATPGTNVYPFVDDIRAIALTV